MSRPRWRAGLCMVFLLAVTALWAGGARAAEPVRIRVGWVVATPSITCFRVPR